MSKGGTKNDLPIRWGVFSRRNSRTRKHILPETSPPDAASNANPVRLIVCERTGRWAVGLRRELADGVPVCETRSLAHCWEALAETPAAFLVLELRPAWLDDLLKRVAAMAREFPAAEVAMVADRSLADHEWLAREAGAVHFTCSPRQLAPLAVIAARHLATIPVPQQTLTERIWASLPWKSQSDA